MRRRHRTASSHQRVVIAVDVVVVEDHEDSRLMIEELLASSGMRVRSFATASEAIAAMRGQWPDLVLTDLVLAGEDGQDLAALVRAEASPRVPILVAMTGMMDRVATHACFDAALLKPLDVAQLPELLRTLVAGRRRAGRVRRGPS